MAKRWREVRQNRPSPATNQNKTATTTKTKAFIFLRMKAFLIDMFLINMPILYIVTYVILGSKEAFQQNGIAIFICTALFGIILSIFFCKKGQSPGYKAYEIKLVCDKTDEVPSFLRALFRYFCFVIAFASLIGILLTFFRQDGKNLHDILSKTHVIKL